MFFAAVPCEHTRRLGLAGCCCCCCRVDTGVQLHDQRWRRQGQAGVVARRALKTRDPPHSDRWGQAIDEIPASSGEELRMPRSAVC